MILLLLAFLLPQEPPPFKTEIIVVAERGETEKSEVAAATSVLDRADIEAAPAQDLGALVARIEGFRVAFEHAGAPMISSRGFFGGGEVESVRVLVDGVPVADAESGLVDWRRIRASNVERIEVLRGPGTSLYGDSAIGGVISVTTRHGLGTTRSLDLEAGSLGSGSLGVNHSGQLGTGLLGLSGLVSAGRGSRDHSAEENHGVDLAYRLPIRRWHAAVAGSYSLRDREDPGPLPLAHTSTTDSDPIFRFDSDEGSRGRLAISLHGDGLQIDAHATARSSEIVRTLLLAPGFGDRTSRDIETHSAGFSLVGEHSFRAGRFRGGLDVSGDALDTRYETLEGRELLAEGDGNRRRYALFATQELVLSGRVRLVGGVRWDEIRDSFSDVTGRRTDSAISPRVGINVQLGNSATPWVVFGSIADAFKAPTLDQRFDPRPFPDGAGGTFTISNPGLEPQKGRNFEFGATHERARESFHLVAYRMTVDDEIDFDASTFTYENIGRSRHTGIEASARFRNGSHFEPAISYALTRAESLVGVHRGRQLKNIPEHLARAELRTRWAGEVSVNASLRWTGEWFLDDANEFRIAPATLIDLRASKRFARAILRLDVLNLFDRNYTEVGFTLRDFEGNVVPYAYPGAGVSARVGVTWEF